MDVQGEYLQQREYGNVPSFGRTQRAHSLNNNSATSSSAAPAHRSNSLINNENTHLEEPEAETLYRILPADVSVAGALQQIRTKLDHLHISQRDYVFAQLLHDDGAYLRSLFAQFEALEAALQALREKLRIADEEAEKAEKGADVCSLNSLEAVDGDAERIQVTNHSEGQTKQQSQNGHIVCSDENALDKAAQDTNNNSNSSSSNNSNSIITSSSNTTTRDVNAVRQQRLSEMPLPSLLRDLQT